MEGALGWIGEGVRWLAKFIPRWEIIDTTHGGVKFVYGKNIKVVGPGIHWWWPLVTQFNTYPTARQANTLPPQTLMTSDGQSVGVSALIVYEVEDIEPLVAHTFDPDNTIEDIAQAAVHDVLSQQTWDELRQGSHTRTLHTTLRQEAQKGLKPFGVRVLRVSLVDLAPCYMVRLLQATKPVIKLPELEL